MEGSRYLDEAKYSTELTSDIMWLQCVKEKCMFSQET